MLDRSFDDVKFEMEKGDPFTPSLLPADVASLDGQRIRIRGYILPSFQQEGITQFVLVRDNMECCFGPGAALYDCIVVRMMPGKSTNFSVRPVAVSGTFHGRDIFAPVAAGLSLDISLYEFGEKVNSLHILPIPRPVLDPDGTLIGQVIHVDRFGNLITDIKSNDLPREDVVIEVSGYCIQGVGNYYAQKEGIMALCGSTGYVEISLRDGSACDFLGTIAGDEVRVTTPA